MRLVRLVSMPYRIPCTQNAAEEATIRIYIMETCLCYGYNVGAFHSTSPFLCSHNFSPSSSGKSVTSVTSPRTLCGWCSTLLVGTPLSTREVWGFSLEGVPSLLFFFFYRAPLGFTLSHTPPLSKVLAQMLNQRTCRCPLLPSVSVVTDKY